jgi:hypothetical protein
VTFLLPENDGVGQLNQSLVFLLCMRQCKARFHIFTTVIFVTEVFLVVITYGPVGLIPTFQRNSLSTFSTSALKMGQKVLPKH